MRNADPDASDDEVSVKSDDLDSQPDVKQLNKGVSSKRLARLRKVPDETSQVNIDPSNWVMVAKNFMYE